MSLSLPEEPRFGIHSLDCFALEVPSLEDAESFFTAFGLEVSTEAQRIALRAEGDVRPWAYCHAGASKRLAYLSFSCFAEEYSALVEQVRQTPGARVAPASPYVSNEGAWFLDPDDNLFQIKVGPKRTLSDAPVPNAAQRPPGTRGAPIRSQAPKVRPSRLSHVMLFTPDVQRLSGFYLQSIGLRMSDWSKDIVAFTHARHGSDHHLLAFVKSEASGWHHSSWDVPSVNDVGRGAGQMQAAGYAEGWGTAQHVLGSNYFHYVRDPWGSFAEYSADIDYIPAGTPWASQEFEPEDSLYLWGPDMPEYFVQNTEA